MTFPWPMTTLKNGTALLKDGTHFSPDSKTGPFRYITSKNIRDGHMDLSDCCYISEEHHRRIFDGCPVRYGDVLLTKDGASVGNVCQNNLREEFSLLSSVAVIRGKPDLLRNEFLLQFFLSPRGKSAILGEVSGQAITRVTLSNISQLKVPVPPLEVQDAIVTVLSSWDRGIRQLSDLITAKVRFKQGLMQRLLSGGLRFSHFAKGQTVPTQLDEVFAKVGEPVEVNTEAAYREIGIRSHGKGIFHKEPVSGSSLGNKRVYAVIPGCLTLNIVFAWERALAVTTDDETGMIASHRFPMFRPNKERILPEYALLYLLSPKGAEALQLASPGGAGRNRTLSQTEFLKISFPLPSVAEQRMIINLVQAADREIDLLRQELDLLKTQKRGLMQKLLTGQVRVKLPKGAS